MYKHPEINIKSKFDSYNEGTILLCINHDTTISYCLKIQQDPAFHTDGMLANLFTGQLIHYSHYKSLMAVYGSEIQW